MQTVTFQGPQNALRLRGSRRLLRRGVPTEVTNDEAARLAAAKVNVTVDTDQDDGSDED